MSSVEPDPSAPVVTGAVAIFLRTEGAAAFLAAIVGYHALGSSWILFAVLFLTPDLTMLAYFVNRKFGAQVYNLAHTYVISVILGLIGLVFAMPVFYALALISIAHIGMDRFFGYGLKYPAGFGATHLGSKGGRDKRHAEPTDPLRSINI